MPLEFFGCTDEPEQQVTLFLPLGISRVARRSLERLLLR
jgi:hypothetical protein